VNDNTHNLTLPKAGRASKPPRRLADFLRVPLIFFIFATAVMGNRPKVGGDLLQSFCDGSTWSCVGVRQPCRLVIWKQPPPAYCPAKTTLPRATTATTPQARVGTFPRHPGVAKIGGGTIPNDEEQNMAVTLYSGFVPVCVQLLTGLKSVLKK